MPSLISRWRAPHPRPLVQTHSFHWLIIVPVLLAIATTIVLFFQADVNVGMLFSQCHSHERIGWLSRIPVLGTPACYMVSFFHEAIASRRTFAVMSAILSFVGGLLTVSTVEAARICNAPNVLIAYPVGPWLVFNLIGGAVVWELVIIPAFFHRARRILTERKEGGRSAIQDASETDPTFGQSLRNITIDAEIVAIPVSVALGFVVPSALMLVFDTPPIILVWLFFPVLVSVVRTVVRHVAIRVQADEQKSFHLESNWRYLVIVYLIPVACSILSHGLLLWSLLQPDDRREMTRSTIKFVEIDAGLIGLTVLYWLFVEAGWRVTFTMIVVSLLLGPGAGVCIGWIYRETEIYDGLSSSSDESQERRAERGEGEAPGEETPLLHS